VYCTAGDTPILIGDGSHRPISELRVGDEIYGTQRRGRYRRYVRTHVLARWSTIKPAWQVVLEDGTELVASGEHRFLTERGWKHVAPAERPEQRPHLTTPSAAQRPAVRSRRARSTACLAHESSLSDQNASAVPGSTERRDCSRRSNARQRAEARPTGM